MFDSAQHPNAPVDIDPMISAVPTLLSGFPKSKRFHYTTPVMARPPYKAGLENAVIHVSHIQWTETIPQYQILKKKKVVHVLSAPRYAP